MIRFCLVALALMVPAAAIAEPALRLDNAWVRALPPTQPNTAAYLTLVNPGAAPVEVVAARSPLAERVEFHATREVDGYVRMTQLATLVVPPGQSLDLAPGGTHLMLLGLSAMPQPGESVGLCLATAAGAELCIEAPVRKQADDDAHQHHHH